MKYLTSKSIYSFSAKKLTLLIISFLSLFLLSGFANKSDVYAQDADPVCVGKELTKYMNDIVLAKDNGFISEKVQLASPIFNLTNEAEVVIFQTMVKSGALFNSLDAWAGNLYTTFPDDTGFEPNRLAYDHFLDKHWADQFFTGNKPIFFTEFGENSNSYSAGTHDVARMKSEFDRASANPFIRQGGIAYFNALGTGNNQQFGFHILSSGEYSAITGNSSIAGVNKANNLDPNDVTFFNNVRGWGGGVGVEILNGQNPRDVASYANTLNSGNGYKLFLRLCYAEGCPYADSQELVNFIRELDDGLSDGVTVWIATGPNEPATELWATPGCIVQTPFDTSERIACNDSSALRNPEYHSLRPYPTSSCVENVESVYMCAKDFVVKQSFTLKREDFPSSSCIDNGSSETCTTNVSASGDIALDLSNAKLPIMGNTELVPNGTNGGASVLNSLQRVNNYVSWYMNGVTSQKQEEEEILTRQFPSVTDEQKIDRINEVINLSGPLKKLLPFAVQNSQYKTAPFTPSERVTLGYREREKQRIGDDNVWGRHDQIVVCSDGRNAALSLFPTICYRGDVTRLSRIEFANPVFKLLMSYVPFSSTEDLPARTTPLTPVDLYGADAIVEGPTLEINADQNNAKTLFFAHMIEGEELGDILQRTYLPKVGNISSIGIDEKVSNSIKPVEIKPGCEIVETRSNPGDSLYGDLTRDEKNVAATLKYTVSFTCDFPKPPTVDNTHPDVIACVNAVNPPGECGAYTDTAGRTACCISHVNASIPAPDYECHKEVTIPLQYQVGTPLAEHVWQRYVAGNMGIFRRIYPKIQSGAPVEAILDVPAESNAGYQATNGITDIGTVDSTQATAGNPNGTGGTGTIYFPHIGGIQDYFLRGIQAALRPKGIAQPEDGTEDQPAGQCTVKQEAIEQAIVAAAGKYGVPQELLRAIYCVEGFTYWTNPNNWTCAKNGATALGLVQYTDGLYLRTTCASERVENDYVCDHTEGKLSRCNTFDAFELAARGLLSKVLLWQNRSTVGDVCEDIGDISVNDITTIYKAAWQYYGGSAPDTNTKNFARGAVGRAFCGINACKNGNCDDMGYGDVICALMARMNYSLPYCNSPSNFPPR